MTGRNPPMVFFDIGSTLVTGPKLGPASRLAKALNLRESTKLAIKERMMTLPIRSAADLVGHLIACGVDAGAAAREADTLWRAQRGEARTIYDAATIVHALQAAGIRVGLISNIWYPYAESIMAALPTLFNGANRCNPIVLSFEVGYCKPDPAIFRHALNLARVEPECAMMIGDSYNEDILPAINLGMKTIWLIHRPQQEAKAMIDLIQDKNLRPSEILISVTQVNADLVLSLFKDDERR